MNNSAAISTELSATLNIDAVHYAALAATYIRSRVIFKEKFKKKHPEVYTFYSVAYEVLFNLLNDAFPPPPTVSYDWRRFVEAVCVENGESNFLKFQRAVKRYSSPEGRVKFYNILTETAFNKYVVMWRVFASPHLWIVVHKLAYKAESKGSDFKKSLLFFIFNLDRFIDCPTCAHHFQVEGKAVIFYDLINGLKIDKIMLKFHNYLNHLKAINRADGQTIQETIFKTYLESDKKITHLVDEVYKNSTYPQQLQSFANLYTDNK
ncbi:sulfhydryloxidase p33 [Cotesia congregata filamentous virus 1]|uniref:Sulfhydryl oxidase n=1 Tax=Cotesia congregata filamentous virus 1 TaxID=3064291 RepID=A0ABC8QK22_9VIRU|nr:sulfhydryloxidase p33 [Cotesia congregata filamentous virus 1]